MLDLIVVLLVAAGLMAMAIWLYLSTRIKKALLDVDTSALSLASLGSHVNRGPIIAGNAERLSNLQTKEPLYAHSGAGSPGSNPLAQRRRSQASEASAESPPRIINYQGIVNFPKRIYQGNSYNITIDLRPSTNTFFKPLSPLQYTISKDGEEISIGLNIPKNSSRRESLEIELVAAGFAVAGDAKQRKDLNGGRLQYQWNCFFGNSGDLQFTLVFRVTGGSESMDLGRLNQIVRVKRIDHLNERQVWVVSGLCVIVSSILTALAALKTLGAF